jgi:hypothetical protein
VEEPNRRRRPRGSGGITQVADDVWRVDIEAPRQPGERRRRVSRQIRGSRADAEQLLAQLSAGQLEKTRRLSALVPADIAAAMTDRAERAGRSLAEEVRMAVAAWVREGS